MDNSTKKLGGGKVHKNNRSLDLKSLYKSRVDEADNSNKEVFEENDIKIVDKKKKKRSRKEVPLSSFEPEAKKSRKEDVAAVESEQGFGRKSSGGSKALHGVSLPLSENGKLFIFPRRPRGLVGRRKLGTNRVSRPLGLPNFGDLAGAFNGKVIKPKGEVGTGIRLAKSAATSAGNDDLSNLKSAGKVVGLNSKLNRKADKISAGGAKSKTKQNADHVSAGGSNSKTKQKKGKISDGGSDSKTKQREDQIISSLSKLKKNADPLSIHGLSDSQTKQKEDPKATGCSNTKMDQKSKSANIKLKRKAGTYELKESGDAGVCSVRYSEKVDSLAIITGDTSSKKRRGNSKKKELVIARDICEASKKKSEASVSENLLLDFDEDDYDEEKLEQNAALMLSSRFDPSCTGFPSKRKSTVSEMVKGFPLPVSSSPDSFSQHANASCDFGSTSAGNKNRDHRPKKVNDRKGVPKKRQRRHFYEIIDKDLDPLWFLQRRIKVYWPLDQSWYCGIVDDYHPESKVHHIKYDDREEEWIDLQEEKFKLLLLPSEVTGKARSKHVLRQDNDAQKVEAVDKGETISIETDDSCRRNNLDSEPTASWLARSSRLGYVDDEHLVYDQKNANINVVDSDRARSDPHFESTTADNLVHHGTDSCMLENVDAECAVCTRTNENNDVVDSDRAISDTPCESTSPDNLVPHGADSSVLEDLDFEPEVFVMRNANTNVVDSDRARSNPHRESTSPDNFVLYVPYSNLLGNVDGICVVFTGRNGDDSFVVYAMENGDGSSEVYAGIESPKTGERSVSCTVTPLIPATFSSPTTEDDTFDKFVGEQLWSIDHEGTLRVNFMLVASKEFRFHICVPSFHLKGMPFGTWDFWWLRDMLMLQHGVMMTTSPTVYLEILFLDDYWGLKFLLFEGCMMQALSFVFRILQEFGQPDEQYVTGNLQSSVTSIRLKLSAVHDLRKNQVIEFHTFSRLHRSKRAALDSELLRHCALIQQLDISECTYNKLKELECGRSKQHENHVDLKLPSYMALNNNYVPCILPMGVTEEACKSRINPSASLTGKCGDVPQFSLSFSAAPTFKLIQSVRLLMRKNSAMGNLNHCDAPCLPESSEIGSRMDIEGTQTEPIVVAFQDIPSTLTSTKSPTSNLLNGSNVGVAIVDFPSCDQVNIHPDGTGCTPREASAGVWSVNGFVDSRNPTGRISKSSPNGQISPSWNGGPKFTSSGFYNGPKRRRTQVRNTLYGSVYDFSSKERMQNQRVQPGKRIGRASQRGISNGSRSSQKNLELLTCGANILVTDRDKGWRESGAVIVLEAAEQNEWRLAVKLSRLNKYSYKVKHVFQPGSKNRYSHAMMWKGGTDWVLEFPDMSQWMLFKEMHQECYNRNIHAASVKKIPIPGVRLIEESRDCGAEIPYIRDPTMYFKQVQNDVEMAMDPSHTLYDMDSDDERWLMAKNKTYIEENSCDEISEEVFERTMDVFEKVSYVRDRINFTDAEIREFVIGIGSVEVAKVIYEHWRGKRERKGMALIRHLQPPLWQRYQQQLKEWEKTVGRPAPQKPLMLAFCMKPRGLNVPKKGLRRRSLRKIFNSASANHSNLPVYGRRSNKTRVEPSNVVMMPDSTSQRNHDFQEPQEQRMEHLNNLDLPEYRAREAKTIAERAVNWSKLRKERAKKMATNADELALKAARLLIAAELMQASNETSN